MAKLKTPVGNRQQFHNGEVHNWYNFVLGYSDKFVRQILREYPLKKGDWVLDPFCGNGTTLVECAKAEIKCIGIDANPFSRFVSKTKTAKPIPGARLARDYTATLKLYNALKDRGASYNEDSTYEYIVSSGMLERGWISAEPLKHAVWFKKAIIKSASSAQSRNLQLLILASLLPSRIGNMRYGPQIYRGPVKSEVNFLPEFHIRIRSMIADLAIMQTVNRPDTRVYAGDSRNLEKIWTRYKLPRPKLIITSPPYPTEHDYTRATRLELALLEEITSADCVQTIKRDMIRSHTKGVYKSDRDDEYVNDNKRIQNLAKRVEIAASEKTSGFARLYPKLTKLYFGGMKRHLIEAYSILRPGGTYVMLVGDQRSYYGVRISSADILAELAEEVGFIRVHQSVWRNRWATSGAQKVSERIIALERPLD